MAMNKIDTTAALHAELLDAVEKLNRTLAALGEKVQFNMPEIKIPHVVVPAPQVTVQQPPEQRPQTYRAEIQRDNNGRIKMIVMTPEGQE